jgi:hypothetical protein
MFQLLCKFQETSLSKLNKAITNVRIIKLILKIEYL